jgi:hypothetical protein
MCTDEAYDAITASPTCYTKFTFIVHLTSPLPFTSCLCHPQILSLFATIQNPSTQALLMPCNSPTLTF